MATLAKLVVKLITDVSEFEAGMTAANKKLTKIGDEMSKVGDTLTTGVTLPILAAGTAAVKFSSDLDETRNKTAVVFGSMSDDVMQMGKTANTALGMSQNAALSYASTYGSILKNMGLTEQQTADMSKSLVQLTADYASFHNLSPEESFEKIKAGLVGSSEPLISLGKDLRVASVEAYAMANGIGTAGQELSQSELALARYGLLLSQSGDEMGDFSRTSDGLANSTRILGATIEDTLASFGEVAIPTVTTFLQALIPILQFFNNLPQPVKVAIVNFLLLAAALGPILSIGGRIVSLFGAIAGLFGTGGALAGAGAWITGTLLPALGAVPGMLAPIGAGLAALSAPVLALIAAIALLVATIAIFGKQAWNTVEMLIAIFGVLLKQVGQQLEGIGPAVQQALRNALQSVGSWFTNFYRAGQNLMAGFVNGIVSYATTLYQTVYKIVQNVIDAVKNMLGIHSKSRVFMAIGENQMLGWESGIADNGKKPGDATSGAAAGVIQAAGAIKPGSGGRSISVGPITINGDLSASAKERLKAEMLSLFTSTLEEALA